MTELEMITGIRPDAALPEPGELAAARSRLTAAIAAAHVDGPAPTAGPRRPRRFRHRRAALVAAALTGAAAIGVAAVLVTPGGPRQVPRPAISSPPAISPLSPRAAALVISRAEQALTSAERRNLIQEIHAVGQNIYFALPPGPGRDAFTNRAVILVHRGLILTQGLTAEGQRLFDASLRYIYAPHGLTLSSVTVNYTARTWWRNRVHQHMRAVPIWSPPHSCPAVTPSPAGSPGSDWPAEMRLALRCGQYHVVGTGRVDGVSVIKVVQYRRLPHRARLITSQVVWISRSTYLPVRVQWWWSWSRSHGVAQQSLTGNFTWLEPTQANLASLRVTIPRGYRQLPPKGPGGVAVPTPP
jgi:hypothetical protein